MKAEECLDIKDGHQSARKNSHDRFLPRSRDAISLGVYAAAETLRGLADGPNTTLSCTRSSTGPNAPTPWY